LDLINAATKGDIDTVIKILAKGANVDARDKYGETALIIAAMLCNTTLVQILLDRGADMNVKSYSGKTALMLAEKGGYAKIVELLKQHGAIE
jgi:ankyrin repeat protein